MPDWLWTTFAVIGIFACAFSAVTVAWLVLLSQIREAP